MSATRCEPPGATAHRDRAWDTRVGRIEPNVPGVRDDSACDEVPTAPGSAYRTYLPLCVHHEVQDHPPVQLPVQEASLSVANVRRLERSAVPRLGDLLPVFAYS